MNIPIKQTIKNAEHRVGNRILDYGRKFIGNSKSDEASKSPEFINSLNQQTKVKNDNFFKGVKSYKKGGIVHKTGVYRLHKGEVVVPKNQVEKAHKNWMLSDGGAVKT